jgi:hypothetical protein
VVVIREFAPTSLDDMREKFGDSLGRGASRFAFPFGKDVVVKFDRSYETPWANLREWEVWSALKDTEAGKYLCPIIGRTSDCRVVMQPRITPIDKVYQDLGRKYWNARTPKDMRKWDVAQNQLMDTRRSFNESLRSVCEAQGWDAFDLHDGNVGLDQDGNMVVLDYGHFRRREARTW